MQASDLESLKAVQAASFDIVVGLTTKTLNACEQLTALGMQMLSESLAASQKQFKAATVKDVPELVALQMSLVEPATESMRARALRLCEIAAGARAEYQKVAQAHFDSSLRNMQQAFDKAQGAPIRTDGTWSAWQSTLASTAAFYDSMQQAHRYAIELAEHQVIDAATAASSARAARSWSQRVRRQGADPSGPARNGSRSPRFRARAPIGNAEAWLQWEAGCWSQRLSSCFVPSTWARRLDA